jgi:exonuclease VII small subunit
LDLDAMVGKVERGYGLIKAMRQRLEETRQKVEHLRVELE